MLIQCIGGWIYIAILKAKVVKNNQYWYIVTSKRPHPGAKPKEVILEYIGSTAKLSEWVISRWSNEKSSSAPPENSSSQSLDTIFQSATFKSYIHGSPFALLKTAESLNIINLIDEIFPKKTIHGFSRGTVLVLAAIQRAVHPGSKAEFSKWVPYTSLPYHMNKKLSVLDSQAFWEAMDNISEDDLKEIQVALVKVLLEKHPEIGGILNELHMDYTNYYTFIDSNNKRCTLCARGHNKQGRHDLRQFGLSLVTAFGLAFPLVWRLNNGNTNDKSAFPDIVKQMFETLSLAEVPINENTVIVFDGGSNSEKNFKDMGCHFITNASLSSFKELYDIDIDRYEKIQINDDVYRYACFIENLEFFGCHGNGLLVISDDLYEGQKAELCKQQTEIEAKIAEYNERLKDKQSKLLMSLQKQEKEAANAKLKYQNEQEDLQDLTNAAAQAQENELQAKKSYQNIQKAYKKAVKRGLDQSVLVAMEENMKMAKATWDTAKAISKSSRAAKKKSEKKLQPTALEEFRWDEAIRVRATDELFAGKKKVFLDFSKVVVSEKDNTYFISLSVDDNKKETYMKKYFGKKLLVTTQVQLSAKQILLFYFREWIVEDMFRFTKDKEFISLCPQFHWTDDKIRVHTFICLLSVILVQELYMRIQSAGLTQYSKHSMMTMLETIHDGWIIDKGVDGEEEKREVHRVMEDLDEEQQALWDAITSTILK